MAAVVVVGVQWGDEGKGKAVDCLAADASMVVRFQGGNNAGHTLVVGGEPLVVHLLPSSVLREDCIAAIGSGVVLDPEVLLREVDLLQTRGWTASPSKLLVDHRAAVILPHHRLIDSLRERRRGDGRIGTTGRGIGPCYEDVASRRAVRVADLIEPARFQAALDILLPEKEAIIDFLGGSGPEPGWRDQYLQWGARIAPFVSDVSERVSRTKAQGGHVLLEGAQGTMLDVVHGTLPFVTSSHTIAGGACTGLGVGPSFIDGVVGIVKAYTTRVGAGPFPTEAVGELGQRLQSVGVEFGATTGRRRRCGWFDAVGVRKAVRLNGITSLVLTKLDVLSGIESIPVAVDRDESGAPVYEQFPGWEEDISGVRQRSDLPVTCRSYIDALESFSGAPIDMISVGPDRTATLGTETLLKRVGLR